MSTNEKTVSALQQVEADKNAGKITEADAKAKTATILSLASGSEFDPALVQEGEDIILRAVKQTSSLTADLFAFFRECEDLHIALGTLTTAESRVIAKVNKDHEGDSKWIKIKSLKDLAELQGVTQLSYQTTKSMLKSAIENEIDLVAGLQAWYDWQTKHQGEPAVLVQDGFLNLWSKRYAPVDDKRHKGSGSTVYFRDLRMAKDAVKLLDNAKKQHARTQGAQAAMTPQANDGGSTTQQGMASGGRSRATLPSAVQNALNELVRLVHDSIDDASVSETFISSALVACKNAIAQEAVRFNQERQKEMAKAGATHKPNSAAAEARKQAQAAGAVTETSDESAHAHQADDMPTLTEEDIKNMEELAPDDEKPQPGAGEGIAGAAGKIVGG